MCGRFANQEDNTAAWDAYFDCDNEFASIADTVSVGYNIAPTQTIPVVTQDGWLAARWGMIGPWVKDASEISSKFATFNARSETVSEKATFRSAWSAGRRCIIPAIGYYEWQATEDGKQPYFVNTEGDGFLCFGGLYEPTRDSICASCTIITLPASDTMSSLHHRMPLMFNDPEVWLEGNSFDGHLDDLSWHAVSKTVNNTRNQGIELIQSVN